jgi:3-deoxy-D-manno-octulosonate 8-phosphate phosphatase (KDO 8-P phosphatase)
VKNLPASVRKKASSIRLLLLDVDGVLTDGRIIIDDRGIETKHFHVRDGQGISFLKRCSIDVGFISGRRSEVVRHRAKDLGIALVVQGVQDKLCVYDRIKKKTRLADDQIAYIGDDVIDLPVLRAAGLAVTVSDGAAELKPYADYITLAPGGMGAVREVAEILLKAQKRWIALLPR